MSTFTDCLKYATMGLEAGIKILLVVKKKLKTISQLKKEADNVFSWHIRRKFADWRGNVQCATCAAIKPIADMTNGHYVDRHWLNLRFYEKNCLPQCFQCNCFKKGAKDEHALALVRLYGAEVLEELKAMKIPRQFKRKDYEAIIEKYKP